MTKSFLLIGQSNMAGRGFLREVPTIHNEKIQMLRNGKWQTMAEPINYDRPVAGVGLASSFAAIWSKDNKDKQIGLIPCAEGGSSLDDWAVEKVLFRHAVLQAKLAMENSELIGILWHQGESDSYNGNHQDYYKKFQHIITTLRDELNVPDIPLIIGGLPNFLGKYGFGQHCTEFELVNKELKKFADEQDNCYFVTAEDLTSNPDHIHINAPSLRKFGLRYYEAYSKRMNITEPLPNEEQQLDTIYIKDYSPSEQIHLHIMDLSLGKITYVEFEQKLSNLQK